MARPAGRRLPGRRLRGELAHSPEQRASCAVRFRVLLPATPRLCCVPSLSLGAASCRCFSSLSRCTTSLLPHSTSARQAQERPGELSPPESDEEVTCLVSAAVAELGPCVQALPLVSHLLTLAIPLAAVPLRDEPACHGSCECPGASGRVIPDLHRLARSAGSRR